MAETLCEPDSELEAPDFAALPGDVLRLLFKHLGLKDLLHAASTCLSWNRCSSGAWRSRCFARWQHWNTAPPAAGAADEDWRDTYVQRHKLDAQILQLLSTDACWPAKQSDAYSSILAHGADALDVLAAAARSKALSGLYVGTAYRASTALLLLQAHIAGENLQQLLSAGPGTTATPPDSAEVSPEAFSTADAAGTAAGEQQLNPGVSPQDDSEDPVLEVALQLAQALHPLANMSAVRDIIQQLGDELIRRLDSAGAAQGSMQALELLNALLFYPQAVTLRQIDRRTNTSRGPRLHAHQAAAIANWTSIGIPSASNASCSSEPLWSAVWGRDKELHGPDLSTFEVPCDGYSWLGPEGNAMPNVYSRVDSSCIDSVLAQRGGLPITMAILHRAVGRRAGLDIELVNMPGHVINRVQVMPGSGGGSSSSSSGAGTTAQSVYVDAFYGLVLDEAGLRAIWDANMPHGHPLPSEHERPTQLPSMTAAAVCTHMLHNLWTLNSTDSTFWSEALLEAGMMQLPSRLTPCLLQLAPVAACVISSKALAMLPVQLNLEVETGGPVELYIRHLYRCMPPTSTIGTNWAVSFRLDERLADIQAKLLKEQNQINIRSTQPEVVYPIGTRVCFAQAGVGYVGVVCGWSVSSQAGLTHDVLTGPFQQCVQVKLLPGQLQAARDHWFMPHTQGRAYPAGSMPPWGSSSCVELVEEACGLLQGGWFDPDFEEQVGRFITRHRQQLVSLFSLGDMRGDLRSCSAGIGLFFEAVWFDAAQGQWSLVPNAYMRHRFPEG